MGDGGFHQRLPQPLDDRRIKAQRSGLRRGVFNHLPLARLVAHLPALRLDSRRRVHEAESLRQQGHQFAVNGIDARAHFGHRVALFCWLSHGRHLPVSIQMITGFSGNTQATPSNAHTGN